MTPWLRHHAPSLLVLAGALVFGVLSDLPSLADPVNLAPQTRFTDPQLLAISLVRANLALGQPFAGGTPLLGWPDTADFRPVVWPMLLAGWVMPAGLAFNGFFVLVPALNALGGALLGAALGLDRWSRAAVGVVLACHPWVRETLANGQLEQAWLGGIALVWALGIHAGGGSRWALALLAPTMIVLTFTGPHLGIAAGVGLALFAAGDLYERGRSGWRRWVGVLALGALGSAIAGSWYAGNFSAKTQVFWPKGSPGHHASLSSLPEAASFRGLLFPPGAPDADTQTLHPVYLGLFLLVAIGLGARRAPQRLWIPLVGLLVLAFGEWIGPLPGPYRLLSALSPAITQSQSPYRMMAGVVVAAAVLAAIAVTRGRHLLLFAGVALVETSLVYTRPFPYPSVDKRLDPIPEVVRAGTGSVLDLPLLGPKCPDAAYHYAIEAARRVRPSPVLPAAPAYYPTVPQLARRVLEGWQARPCGPAMASTLAKLGFSTVVLHTHDRQCPYQPSFEACLVDAFGPGVTDEGVRVWDVPGAIVPVRPR